MSLTKLARRLRIKITIGRDQFSTQGRSPTMFRRLNNMDVGNAWLVGPQEIAYDSDMEIPIADLLHEMMHAVCGPMSLIDEMPLMAVQWACMSFLTLEEFKICRHDLAGYALIDNTNIGHTDEFLVLPAWQECLLAAKVANFLKRTGEPNWGTLRDPAKWDKRPR